VITASWEGQALPPVDAEERLAEFAQLLGTAIANADSRDQLTASRARVLSAGDEARRRVVRDLHDGGQQRLVHIGSADPQGHGLLGIGDRVAALGGRLRIDSPRGGGTVLAAELPLPA
jgi:signal transduction histidine kinase